MLVKVYNRLATISGFSMTNQPKSVRDRPGATTFNSVRALSANPGREEYWWQSAREYGAALERLAWAYELDPDRRRDLLQEIHLALWRSFENFDVRCSLRTWTCRVAHNVAIFPRHKAKKDRAGLRYAAGYRGSA